MFKSKKSSITSSSSPTSPTTPERIRSKQPFSAIPIEQRKRPGHIPLDQLLETYDDYPLLVKDFELVQEKLRIAQEEIRRGNAEREELQAQLDAEREGRDDDRIRARESKEEAERMMNRKVRGELDPKIADLEKKLKEMTTDRDRVKEELRIRNSKLDGWTGQLSRLYGESAQQAEKEAKAAEERLKVLEKSRKLNLEILEGLRDISANPDQIKTESSQLVTTATSNKSAKSAFHEDWKPKKERNYGVAD